MRWQATLVLAILLLGGCAQPSSPSDPGVSADDGLTTLSMQVVHADSGVGLSKATVDVRIAGLGVVHKTTDSDGKVAVTIKPAKSCTVTVSLAGYQGGSATVDCRSDQALRIPLKPIQSSTPGAGANATAPRVKIQWSPDYPTAGQTILFDGRVENAGNRTVKSWAWTWGDAGNTTGTGATPTHAYTKAGDWEVTATATMSDDSRVAGARHVLVYSSTPNNPPPSNQTPGPAVPPPPPGVFDCDGQTIVEPTDTFGSDDSAPNLAWAALKTGFRAAVVWSSETPTTASLSYFVERGPATTLTETVPTKVHLFVLDGLPVGRTFCFQPVIGGQAAPMHALRLANGPTAYQSDAGPDGVYSINLLTLVNEGGDVNEVEAGMERYATMVWDATDGHVRAGANLVIVGDYLHHNAGWALCYIPGASSPVCNQIFDVLFTEDAVPQGAASTYRRGIHDREAAIWMNMHFQAVPGPISYDDPGAVLTHELGHYAFDMDDLYGDPVVPDSQDCTIGQYSISIMGGSRDVTEFDDALHPCPTQGSGYVPSWTLMRGEFPNIPERADIDPGPEGNGGLHLLRTYRGAV